MRPLMTTPLLAGRYLVGETLGGGKEAVVHRAYDVRLGRHIAIKVAMEAAGPALHQRYRHAALTAAALNHPAVVTVYDVGETDAASGTAPYLIMEYVNEWPNVA